ncbi:MAG: head-tail connector protein [Desulfobaccales bacterium]
MDLTTLANTKQWLGISSDTDDDLLTRLITAASFFIETYLGRRLGSQDYAEVRDGTGGRVLNFREYPVTAVSGVTVNGVSLPLAPDTVTPGYRFTRTQIILQGHRFTQGWGNVTLNYTAGYGPASGGWLEDPWLIAPQPDGSTPWVPFDLEQACIELISWRYEERQHIGQSGKSLQGANVTYIVQDLPPDVKTILDRYRRVVCV